MKNIFSISLLIMLCSCSTSQLDRLEWLGKEPPFQPVQPKLENKIVWPSDNKSDEEKLAMVNRSSNSLWNKSSKTFFKDQRAAKIGDILKVKIQISDSAKLDNTTERKRDETNTTGLPNFFGLEDKLTGLLPGKAEPASLIKTSGALNNKGEGKIDREEKVETEIAAVVTDILPNGNFVIYGSQEMRVNFETRQVTVQGVVRPEDIDPNNEIASSQIAEARISYGGKGIITDIQQPRIGNQIADIISPW
jgi:flagellar L-ring protein precursor FlgH